MYFIKNYSLYDKVYEGPEYLFAHNFIAFKPAFTKNPSIKYKKGGKEAIYDVIFHANQTRRLLKKKEACRVESVIKTVLMDADRIGESITTGDPLEESLIWIFETKHGDYCMDVKLFGFLMCRLGRNVITDYIYQIIEDKYLFIYLDECLCAIVALKREGIIN